MNQIAGAKLFSEKHINLVHLGYEIYNPYEKLVSKFPDIFHWKKNDNESYRTLSHYFPRRAPHG